ncbi:MAG: DUF4382 domain-containing protein [Candidatus Zixiibacteriota bacterium]
MERRHIRQTAWVQGIALSLMMAAALTLNGCSDDEGSTGVSSGEGRVLLLMHDAPVDNFTEIWLTVESVSMIGAGVDDDSTASGNIVLDHAIRMDFLALDSVSMILADAEIEAGVYSKIRLEVSDPEFVRDDDSVFTGDDIHIVANGHVDLNSQGSGIVVEDGAITVVSLDLDAENSIEVNETGSGRYILRPQIFIDSDLESAQEVMLEGAQVVSIDAGGGTMIVELPGSGSMVSVEFNGETQIINIGGLPLEIGAISIGTMVNIHGTLDLETGTVTATQISIAP